MGHSRRMTRATSSKRIESKGSDRSVGANKISLSRDYYTTCLPGVIVSSKKRLLPFAFPPLPLVPSFLSFILWYQRVAQLFATQITKTSPTLSLSPRLLHFRLNLWMAFFHSPLPSRSEWTTMGRNCCVSLFEFLVHCDTNWKFEKEYSPPFFFEIEHRSMNRDTKNDDRRTLTLRIFESLSRIFG